MAINKKKPMTEEELYREERKQRIAKSGKSSKGKLSAKAKKAVIAVVAVVAVCALLAVYVATGAVRGGILSYFGVPQKTLTGITVTDGETSYKITPAQYNFYYSSQYNSLYNMVNTYKTYGLEPKDLGYDIDFDSPLKSQVKETSDDGKETTWQDYLEEQVQNAIKEAEIYYAAAVKNNGGKEPDITEDEQKQIDDALASYKESADKYGYTLDAYLRKAMGKGVNEKLVRHEMKKSTISSAYKTQIEDEVSKMEFTAEDVQAYYNENKAELSSVDAYVYEADSESTAKDIAKALESDAGKSFGAVVSDAIDKKNTYEKEAYKNDLKSLEQNLMKSTAKSKFISMNNEAVEWLYANDRAAGDVASYGSYVMKIVKPAYMSEGSTVNVRHILIKPEVGEDKEATDATTEQWAAAKTKAEGIVAQWKTDGATEEAFSALVKDNTADTSSASNGGLIEDAYPGQMVNEFGNWIFGDRKAGDLDIVKSDFGYHIIYFVSAGDTPYWQTVAASNLGEDAKEDKLSASVENFEVKINWLGEKFFVDDVALAS